MTTARVERSQPARPAARVADLRDVRHYVMWRLLRSDSKLGVVSSETYPVANGRVEVTMVVHDAHRRWLESDLVNRDGSHLKVLARSLHAMADQPAIVAGVGSEP